MKSLQLFRITAIAFLGVLPAVLSAQINLSQSSRMSEMPSVIVRPNGEIMVAWTEGTHFNADGVIYYRTWTESGGWTPARAAVHPELGSCAWAQLAVDAQGDIHMTYHDGSSSFNRQIYYIKYANGMWGRREMVYNGYMNNSTWPRIDVEGNRIYIVWGQNHTTDPFRAMDIVFMEKVDGGSWPSQPRNISQTFQSVSIHSALKVRNGKVHVAWMDDNHYLNNWNIYHSERIGGTWRTPVHVQPESNQYHPSLAIDHNETVHLIYSLKSNPIIHMRKPLNGHWTGRTVISTALTSVVEAPTLRYHGGSLHAVWRQYSGAGDDIFYSRGTINGQWETPTRVSNGGNGAYTGMDIDNKGRVHIVYSDNGVGGHRDVFYARLDQVSSYPVASFTATPTQGAPPLAVSFDASDSYDPDGYIVSYAWTFGDGAVGSGQKVSHTYTRSGLFNARLTVTDNDGNSSSNARTITVGQPPVALFTATPTSGGVPLKVQFDASASYDPNDGSIVSYRWDFGDGNTGQGKTLSHVYTTAGIRSAVLTVRNSAGIEASATTQITAAVMPTALFSAHPTRGTVPLAVAFNASASKPSESGGNIVSYQWNFGDGNTGSGQRITHTYRNYGTYKATLTVTDNLGRKATSSSGPIQVLSPPTAVFTAHPTKGVVPMTVTFNASESFDRDGWIETYKWDLGDENHVIQPGKTLTHTYTRAGDIVVRLTVIDNDGLIDSTSQTLQVFFDPFPPLNVNIRKAVFEGLFMADYINILTWERNALNDGFFHIVKHRIYRKKKGEADAAFVLIREGPGNVFSYEDGGLGSVKDMESYVYGVSFVDERNRESPKTQVTVPDAASRSGEPTRSFRVPGSNRPVR